MAFELIPFPISVLFIAVFFVAFELVLWKLRKKGRFYSILFDASIVLALIVFISIIFSGI